MDCIKYKPQVSNPHWGVSPQGLESPTFSGRHSHSPPDFELNLIPRGLDIGTKHCTSTVQGGRGYMPGIDHQASPPDASKKRDSVPPIGDL